jgi:hypothetical protein
MSSRTSQETKDVYDQDRWLMVIVRCSSYSSGLLAGSAIW